MDFNELLNEAKKVAGEHPDQARAALAKAEGVWDARTGGKFAAQIRKGGDAVGGQLGLPPDAL